MAGGRIRSRSKPTTSPRRGEISRLEENLRLLERGRIELPAGTDVGLFLVTDGRVTGKPAVAHEPTVADVFALYAKNLTAGAKEANTRKCESIHMRHLERLLGGKTPVARVTTAIIQHYVDRRAAEKYRSKPIKPQTIKKEVATLLTVWNWAARRDHVAAPCSTKGITFPKEKEKPQFRTFDQVKAIVARGGLSKTESRELWDGLFLSKDEVAEVLAHARENAGSE